MSPSNDAKLKPMKAMTAMVKPALTIDLTLRALVSARTSGTMNAPSHTPAKTVPNRSADRSLSQPAPEEHGGERGRRQDHADDEIAEVAPEEAVAALVFDARLEGGEGRLQALAVGLVDGDLAALVLHPFEQRVLARRQFLRAAAPAWSG